MSSPGSKDALFEAIAVMGKAFASPRRLELIDLLAQGPRSVDELARASGQSTANASQHLQALHAAGVVTRERAGTRVTYSLAGQDVLRLWLELRDASATRVAEVERAARNYLGDEVEAISRDELLTRLRHNDVVLVDVRPAESSTPATSTARSRSRSTSSTSVSPNCLPAPRSSPTAGARSARTRTRRSACSALRGAPHDGSKAAGPNGSSRRKH
jgi:DNA-binding transcriptional ArsR family regulator